MPRAACDYPSNEPWRTLGYDGSLSTQGRLPDRDGFPCRVFVVLNAGAKAGSVTCIILVSWAE